MSEGNIDDLLKICSGKQVLFSNHKELYAAIDGLSVGEVPWQSFLVQYNGVYSNDSSVPQPQWMSDVHKVFYCDPQQIFHKMLANPDFKDSMDFVPYCVFNKDGICMY
jgi:hypothetical protein